MSNQCDDDDYEELSAHRERLGAHRERLGAHRERLGARVLQIDRACVRLKQLTGAEGVVQFLLDLVDHDQLAEHVRRRMAELGQRLPAPQPGRWRP